MQHNVHELKRFYQSRPGRLIRRLLMSHVRSIWPSVKGMRVMGCGYAVPYLAHLKDKAERVFAFMPDSLGVHHWPRDEQGLSFLGQEKELPIETESIDRILLVHSLEYSEYPHSFFQELWRILKSDGRLMIIVPNRLGFWARSDATPFGHGRPYSVGQIIHDLKENMFVHEHTEQALFMPPFKSFLVLRTAYTIESFGRYIFPTLAGVNIIEASKQIYAGGTKAPAWVQKRAFVKQTVPTG